MIRKFTIYNLQFTIKFVWLGLFIALFFILYSLFSYQPSFAQTAACPTQTDNPRVTGGLISAANMSDSADKFSSLTGACVVDLKAPFVPYKIPTYEDLKSMYFDQSKSPRKDTITGDANDGTVGSKIRSDDLDRLIYINGNLTINSQGFLQGKPSIPIIVFVQNSLIINKDIDFSDSSSAGGLVFVVSGNVTIDPKVAKLNAVIISAGTIYTAGAGCTTSSVDVGAGTNALTVNGSLISLDPGLIIFCRVLTDNSIPAEKIIQQPKYLVILRNLMSDILQKWSEIQ